MNSLRTAKLEQGAHKLRMQERLTTRRRNPTPGCLVEHLIGCNSLEDFAYAHLLAVKDKSMVAADRSTLSAGNATVAIDMRQSLCIKARSLPCTDSYAITAAGAK